LLAAPLALPPHPEPSPPVAAKASPKASEATPASVPQAVERTWNSAELERRLDLAFARAMAEHRLSPASAHNYGRVAQRVLAFADARGLPLGPDDLARTLLAYQGALAEPSPPGPPSDRAMARVVGTWLERVSRDASFD
jgi:hypothetical protein